MLLDYEACVHMISGGASLLVGGRRLLARRAETVGRRAETQALTGAVTGANGKSTTNVAPPQGGLIARSLAPCACATPAEIASPRPEPRCFVVKNGSKMRSSSSGAMPGPVSATVTVISSVPRVTATRTSPPGGV